MTNIKTPKDLEVMKAGGKILSQVLWETVGSIKPGVTELDIENMAERLIEEKGGEPAFKRVKGYKYATCISTNEVVVHGIPTERVLKEGDVVGIDCGVYYKGFNTDMAETLRVSTTNKQQLTNNKKDKIDQFLEVGKKALEEAIKVAVAGNHIGHISKTIQDIVERKSGYAVVRSLIGHGIGKSLHESPEVPGYLNKKIEKTPRLVPGMTIAIEVIYNMGSYDVVLDKDGWTIASKDGSISGLFERTVAITDKEPMILTA
ncbi:MAG: type I methionyl aminopeptidase [Candidatus Levybacteria bacterium RIFCSPLOWO2_01_FULL_39_10]|nr:MAG: type I methionyl aminopeptidase [Candidatus Levybacteria bacterium RIFCSPLOWO2_01_FULL_39_10]